VLIIDGPDGRTTDSRTVGVDPCSTKRVVFHVTKATAGTYYVSCAGLDGQFTVSGGAFAGLGTGGIVTIAVIVIALIVGLIFVLRRRE
jgi:hypothetical protein